MAIDRPSFCNVGDAMDEALRLYDYGTKGTLANTIGFRIRNNFQNVIYKARF
jgi:hypothetical protein